MLLKILIINLLNQYTSNLKLCKYWELLHMFTNHNYRPVGENQIYGSGL